MISNEKIINIIEGDLQSIEILVEEFKESGFSTQSFCELHSLNDDYRNLIAYSGIYSIISSEYFNEKISIGELFIYLFSFGYLIDIKIYETTVSPNIRAILERLEFVKIVENNKIVSTIHVTELNGLYFFSDHIYTFNGSSLIKLPELMDRVEPPNYSALSLIKTIEEAKSKDSKSDIRPKHMLDIGCGTSIISCFFAKDYEKITAIDISYRAILFSRINSKINNVELDLKSEDCRNLSSIGKYDTVIFNVPSLPRYSQELVAIDSYTSRYGYELLVEFINESLLDVSSEQSELYFWSVFAIHDEFSSVLNILYARCNIARDSIIKIKNEFNSPFSLSARDVGSKKIGFGSFLLDSFSDKDVYFDFLNKNKISEIQAVIGLIEINHPSDFHHTTEEIDQIFQL